jgi:hypothetical protein
LASAGNVVARLDALTIEMPPRQKQKCTLKNSVAKQKGAFHLTGMPLFCAILL